MPISQYERDAGFRACVPLFFMPFENFLPKSLDVSELMPIFAPLKHSCGTRMPPS